ncbi:MAG: nickel pincer cofactor biosynthesis protein LarC [Myxococcota bacterium]
MPRRSSTASSGLGQPPQKILDLDLFSGIAGNMFVAALLDLGLSPDELEADLAGLGVDHRLKLTRVQRGTLSARYLQVEVPGDPHISKHDHGPHGKGAGGRGYREIADRLKAANLREPVRQRALAIFGELAQAEAKVHGVPVDEVHFHEVGAVDAIVDVTAAAAGLDRLGVDRVTASRVALGEGTVETAHGRLPLPAPATLELLKGIPTVPGHVEWETVTPTGAAILRNIADGFGAMPAMTVEAVGLGAGQDRPGPMPNVVRAILGHANDQLGQDRVSVLEANLDDLVPEHFDYVMERLLDAGALDVSLQHLQMKKNRPGFLVRVLAQPADARDLADILFTESGTLGVRMQEWERWILEREVVEVETPYGSIHVKLSRGVDGRISVSAEYDDCKRAAQKSGVALREVIAAAEASAREGRA